MASIRPLSAICTPDEPAVRAVPRSPCIRRELRRKMSGMAKDHVLTPHEAEAVIAECIERYGLDVLPEVTVTALPDGHWRVRWEHLERVVEPMTGAAWRAWLEENVGSLDPGDLQTTES